MKTESDIEAEIEKIERGECGLGIDLSKYKTPAAAAKALHRHIVKMTLTDPKYILLQSPKEALKKGFGEHWRVCWEEGTYEWGVMLSSMDEGIGETWFTEPYYSFDVCFVER